MSSNMDIFLKQNEEQGEIPKVSEDAILEAKENYEQRIGTLMEFFNAAPRKVKRKLRPQAKFGNQLLNKFAKKRLEE